MIDKRLFHRAVGLYAAALLFQIMAVYRAKKKDTQLKKNVVTSRTPVSDESMERLARIMNDSPSLVNLHGTEWCIKG